MKRMVGFGDLLLRLNPRGYLRFLQADALYVNYTGAEANVCVSLAQMGIATDFVTKIPDHEISRCAVAALEKMRVGTSHIARGGERIGIMYLEKGASQRPSRVIYDRRHTAICDADRIDFDWDSIFQGAGLFHFTGITPALSDSLQTLCLDACLAAKRHGLLVSCDLNYRKSLWSRQEAKSAMERLLPHVDLLIANEEDAEAVLGISPEKNNVESGELNYDGYRWVATQIINRFPNISHVAVSLRKSVTASDNEWGAMLYTGGAAYYSRRYAVHLVDRVGGGDSFAAGLLYGIGRCMGAQDTVEYAAAASCLKQTIEGDFNLSTVEEIFALMQGSGSGRVLR